MPDTTASRSRRATRSTADSGRVEALERLKAIRRSGNRRSESGSTIQVKLEEPIYETLAEEEYLALKAKRQEDAKGFIVDDDGLGYAEEGQEEDWAISALPPSSDEDDYGSDGEERHRRKKKKEAKKDSAMAPMPKKHVTTSLLAAAALMGKQRLSSMFTSSTFKKNERVKGSESIVDDLIAEFAPDDTDREERRRKRGPPSTHYVAPVQHAVDPPVVSVYKSEIPCDPDEPQVEIDVPPLDVGTEMNVVGNGGTSQIDDACNVAKEEKSQVAELKSKSNNNDVAETRNGNGVVVEPVPKLEKVSSLNAKRKVEKDEKLMSATAGWKSVCKGDVGSPIVEEQAVANTKLDENLEFTLNTDGTLPFYLIDIHEESYGSNEGTLYLFGKVKVASAYQSCCIIVKNMQRCIYAIPKGNIFQDSDIMNLEKSVANSQISTTTFRTKLQEMSSGLKSEMAKTLMDHNVSCFSMMPVKRGYAFERNDIFRGEKYVLKINYPFKDPPLPSNLKGDLFNAILGTNHSALELFIVKRKIKGPSWLSVSKFTISSAHERVSWCKFEIVIDHPKDINLSTAKTVLEIPPVIVTAINLKTIVSEKHHGNEVVSASAICCHKAKIDGPMLVSDLKRSGVLSSFTILRKLDGGIYPMGFMKNVTDRNLKDGTNILLVESSERALLNRFMIELHKMDTDVLVGHNISGFDLDVLLHRVQACKLPSSMWSKIGRLKRSIMPKLTKGATLYGSGASPGIMSCIAGRLLCDTYLCSRDLLREVSYSLTELAKTQLNKNREEIAPNDIPAKFNSSESLLQLVDCGETDAWLSLELMFHLSILPLTRQLTNISGNLWGKTLQGARAQRVEYLLLHSFHAKKYIVPDKNISKSKAASTMKRRLVMTDDENGNNVYNGDDGEHVEHVKGKKGPAYAGGLVLEPKKGLYDKFVLLLDFNSLYPSIIQEYNICFTTVERSVENSPPNLPSSTTTGILPELLRNLVERRRMVKSWLKTASGLKVQQLDIQQQALKLTANSIYGCLGFSNSRFYAKPIAELITSQGREILQNTVDLVQNLLNLEVIYGDTDSIMIYSGLDDISKARAIAAKVIQEVNKKYRCLEIDLDGLYKRMLLLKKKKYAAVKVQIKDGKPYEVIERKGLDTVRRDWSLLAKEAGEMCLCQILSGGSCDDVVEMIHDYLLKVQDDVRNGEVELEKYVIRKTLTKSPEEYPDGRNQPHVQVALRLKQSGYSTGWSAGDTISYVICCEQGTSSSGGIAERARHPDELKKDITNWMVDIDYYLSQQIHPVVSRLCAFIQGTSPARLADCLGLDSSKFQNKTTESTSSDPSRVLAAVLDESERYLGCEPLRLTCPSCSCSFDCPPISILLPTSSNLIDPETEKNSGNNFWRKMCCPRCPGDADGTKISSAMIANQVKRQAENFVSIYYKGLMICDDELCKYNTRSPNLRVVGDSVRGTICPNYPQCNGRLIKKFTEAEVYKQLSYFCHIFDAKHLMEKLDNSARILFDKELTRVYPTINLAFMTIKNIRDRCAFGWVQLEDLSVTV